MTTAASDRPPVDLLALTARLVDVRSESHAEQELTDLLEAELSRHAPWLAVDRVGCNLVARTTLGREQRLVRDHLKQVESVVRVHDLSRPPRELHSPVQPELEEALARYEESALGL